VGVKANEHYNASKLEEHKRDHALYIAAAPIDAPTVVIAVVVENSGFGSDSAAPIARRVFDYWLLGQYPSEEDLVGVRDGKVVTPVGTPRRAADIPLPGQVAASAPLAAASAPSPARAAAASAPAGKPVRVAALR
jgi:penicillin-binding protein 2